MTQTETGEIMKNEIIIEYKLPKNRHDAAIAHGED